MDVPLGLGVVGCGGAAADVCRAVAGVPSLVVAATHDRDADLAEDLARATGGRAHATLETLLADEGVGMVYIALPHDLLAPMALRALRAGKHVLAEKPMAITLTSLDELAQEATRSGRALGVFYEMRFAPVALAAARLVRGGAIGRVRAIRIRTLIDKAASYWQVGLSGRSRSPWRGQAVHAGGGVILMNSSHQLDLVAAITGLSVERVTGTIATTVPGIDVEDSGAAVLGYAGGAIGTLVASAHAPGVLDGETIEIDGDQGQVMLEAYAGVLRVYLRRPWQGIRAGEWLEPMVDDGDALVGALDVFAAAVLAGTRPPVGAPEARAVLATVLGLYRSSDEGRVIDLG